VQPHMGWLHELLLQLRARLLQHAGSRWPLRSVVPWLMSPDSPTTSSSATATSMTKL
jgi:hypothetical protein